MNVTISSLTGFGCFPASCSGVTDKFGHFSVLAPVGGDVVGITKPYYVDNRTWVTVGNGTTVAVGTIDFVHDGFAQGTLQADLPGHPPVAGVNITASSRDLLVVAAPGNTSAPNGSFLVPVPPFPSVVQFPTQAGFAANESFTNVTPYGVADLGVVYLEGGVRVRAQLYNAATGRPIAAGLLSSLQVCSRRAGDSCPFPVPSQVIPNGPNVSAFALPGPSYLVAMAYGYVVNRSAFPDVPFLAPGGIDDLGRVDLTPMGSLEVSINLTGSSTLPVRWPVGVVTVEFCSLDGVNVALPTVAATGLFSSTCWGVNLTPLLPTPNQVPVGRTVVVDGPPLRDAVFLIPNARGFVFPVVNRSVGNPGWPAPYQAANETWVNLTPDRVTLGGSFDLTPGTYLAGNITAANVSSLGTVEVQACSTDEPVVCAPPAIVGAGAAPFGCTVGPLAFCAPAPPGPDQVVVTALGVGANRTWVEVPRGCCVQDGHPLAIGTIGVPNALPVGTVNGSIWTGPGPGGVSASPLTNELVTVEACLVGPAPPGLLGSTCVTGGTNFSDGSFSLTTLTGWNRVTAVAAGHVTNWTWVDVVVNNTTGPIYLAPDARVAGRVLAPDGSGVYSANVLACPLATLALCRLVGDGSTSTDGSYNGTLPGARYPAGVYQIEASASGYATNWTWVNATAGLLVLAPPIVLAPLGSNASAPRPPLPAAVRPASLGGGAWLDGRLVDLATGMGLPNAKITACPLTGGTCAVSGDSTGYGGDFNTSLPFGRYHLYLNATNHGNASVFANVSAASFLHLGTLRSRADAWVHGRVLLGPWASLTTGTGLGPLGASVQVCAPSGAPCDSAVPLDAAGFFNVSAPYGQTDEETIFGTAQSYFGTADQGYDPLFLTLDVQAPYVDAPTNLSLAPRLGIFGSLSGDLRDGSAWTGSPAVPRFPVAFGTLLGSTNGPGASMATGETGGGGNFTVFEPSDATATYLLGTGSAFESHLLTLPGPVPEGNASAVGNLTLPHFGWVTATVTGGAGRAPLAFVGVSVSVPDPANLTSIDTSGETNGVGFVNVTAAPAAKAAVEFLDPGFSNRTFTVAVSESRSTGIGPVNLTNVTGGGLGAWVESTAVNTVGVPPTSSVVDPHSHAPVQNAVVTVTTSSGATSAPNVRTNALGQFLLLAPPDPYDTLNFQVPAFGIAQASYALKDGERLVIPQVNMTGDGVIAGQVVVQPYGTPAVNVIVSACPAGSFLPCSDQTQTNGNGWFWVDVPAGITTVSLSTEQYLANTSATVLVPSDGWVELAPVPVFALSTITGNVWALPSGTPIVGGNVSLCSMFGVRTGCFESAPTTANGSFVLMAPAGSYNLLATAPDYNASVRSIAVGSGEVVNVGVIFLQSFGILEGTVVNDSSGARIPYAVLTACGAYVGGGCSGTEIADANGSFRFLAPPGTVNLDIAASGYLDNFTVVQVPVGQQLDLGDVEMTPIVRQVAVEVAGRVVEAEAPSVGIASAFVSLLVGTTAVSSTSTVANGRFQLDVDEGSYTFVVTFPGRQTYTAPFPVSGPVADLVVPLAIAEFTVSGTVTEAVHHLPLPGVVVRAGTQGSATTDRNGAFAMVLANGSYTLTLTATGYEPLSSPVTVAGRAVVRDLTLTPIGVRLVVEVATQATGLAIGGAIVDVTTTDGSTTLASGSTDAGGNFSTYLSAGPVLVSVAASGYAPVTLAITLTGGTQYLPVELPVGTSATSPVLPAWSYHGWVFAGIGAAGITTVAVYYLTRRKPPEEPEFVPPTWADIGPAPFADTGDPDRA